MVQAGPYQHLIAAILGLLILAACGTPAETTNPGASSTARATAEVPADSLTDTKWSLTQYGPATEPGTPPEGVQVTVEFTDGRVQGTSACNSYGGSYTVDGSRLSIGELAQTEMACLRDDVMVLERDYLQALRGATSYVVDGDTLTIDYGDGVLRFTRQG